MKVVVEVWSNKDRRLVSNVRKTALKIGRFLRIGNRRLDIILVDDRFMKPNVKSCPAPKGFPGGMPLGEVYLNPGYIKKEGEKLEYMLIHGLLHLLGYDHKRRNDIIIMEKKELECLQNLSSDSTSVRIQSKPRSRK